MLSHNLANNESSNRINGVKKWRNDSTISFPIPKTKFKLKNNFISIYIRRDRYIESLSEVFGRIKMHKKGI